MSKRSIETPNAPLPVGAYNQAVVANGVVYTAGQIGIKPSTGELVTSSFSAEADQIFHNLQAVLAGAGLTLDNVVKFTVYLVDLGNYGELNEVFEKYYPNDAPARSAVQVSALPKNANVEIECIAHCE